jgi:uncharacterized protein DUF5681
MSKKRTGDEVGYCKPPKDTQFQKGVSGNPKGRPKKCRNFDEELIRESESLMPITEKGQRKRLSKHKVAIKQLINQVISGNPSAQRMYFRLLQQAHERAALIVGLQTSNAGENDKVTYLTDEELMRIILDPRRRQKKWKVTRIEYGMNRPVCSAAAALRPPPMLQK